jgi:hypothetical protein
MAVSDLARVGAERRIFKEDTLALISKNLRNDSHEAFIMNMLQSWMRAYLYEQNAYQRSGDMPRLASLEESEIIGPDGTRSRVVSATGEPVLIVKSSGYSDNHVQMPGPFGMDVHEHEIILGPPVNEMEYGHVASAVMRNKDNYWSRPYVLHYNAATAAQETFYLLHTLGRTQVSALNTDFALPGIDPSQLLLDPVNAASDVRIDPDAVPWHKPDILYMWALEYATMNRVEHAFTAAMEVLSYAAAQPVYAGAEAQAWNSCALVFRIPRFSPTRAVVRTALHGEPYLPTGMPHEVLMRDETAPHQFTTGTLLNYLAMYGLYCVVANEARAYDNWRDVFVTTTGDLSVLRDAAALPLLVSAVTGQEVPTCMMDGCSVSYDMTAMATVTQLLAYDI